MIRFSVVIPAYNAALTLPIALESILRQTLAPAEVIVVDDCSTDRTFDVVLSWHGALGSHGIALRPLRAPVNAGPSHARNLGIQAACGTHIAFLDADDRWLPERLQVIAGHLASHDPALLAHPYVDPSRATEVEQGAVRAVLLSRPQVLVRNPCQTSCVVIRRDRKHRFDTSMSYCEDHDLWLRLLEENKGVFLQRAALTVLGRPQLSAGGLSGRTAMMRLGELRVYLKYCRRQPWRRLWLFPLLVSWSLAKHLLSMAQRALPRLRAHG